MKKNTLDLRAVQTLHQSKQFDKAEAGYLALLRKNPHDATLLHALGILYAQTEKFIEAAHYFKTALQHKPDDSILQLHLANALKMLGELDQAAALLQSTTQNHPDYALAFNNLGTIYHLQKKFSSAINSYQRAIEIEPTFIDAWYNLGLAYINHHQTDDAIRTYQKILDLSPEHFAARFQLARALMQHENYNDALTEFLQIEKSQPYHAETQENVAICYLKKGLLNQAKQHYKKALELKENDTQILFNLGVIETQLGNIDNAIQYYQKSVIIDPDFFAAHNNLGTAFLFKQHSAFALQHFQQAARLQPENMSLQYTIHALSQDKKLLSAPTEYIKSLFDSYADHYDEHLLTALDYQLPLHFQNILHKIHASTTMDILDLGCGTGLCGVAVKSFASKLTGVDLSEKMLEIARDKKIYHRLECNNIADFLAENHDTYDLIIAGDVLVYIGDLEKLFSHIKQTLHADGIFLFNCEISESENYKMNQSGRFSHQKKYIENLTKSNKFNILYHERSVTRLQNNEPVYGFIYALQLKSH